jgi:hypothetical protein
LITPTFTVHYLFLARRISFLSFTYLLPCCPHITITHILTYCYPPHRSLTATQIVTTPPVYASQFGPRPQCVHDTIFPTPSLANFLNNNMERVPIDRLGAVYQTCIVCSTSMCDRLHYFQSPRCRQVLKPYPTQAYQEALRHQNAKTPPQAASEPTDDRCSDASRCEVAVRVTRPGCRHVFESRCLMR